MLGTDYFTRIASHGSLTGLHPKLGAQFRKYLLDEKAIAFGDQLVLNTHFPPFPSRAFDAMAAQMSEAPTERRLYSVTAAVTNRCSFGCWHCYNAGRNQVDLDLPTWRNLAAQLQDLGAVMVNLTGGEPLLRKDLEDIFRAFDDRSCLTLGSTGWGLDLDRARRLRDAGVFALGISLDSAEEAEHDRLRARPGAFRQALNALDTARRAGLYPYVVSVATRGFIQRERFLAFMAYAGAAGALEVHLLEPCAVGRLEDRTDVPLQPQERAHLLALQHEVAGREDLPILSTFTHLENPEAFGCGAGITHLYLDGAGEVCPCNLVPLSFGNAAREPLATILDRMGEHFRLPRAHCLGQSLTPHARGLKLPLTPEASCALCEAHLPKTHEVPGFFRARLEAKETTGPRELRASYDEVAADYDAHWLSGAGSAVEDLVERLQLDGTERVLEVGCGTGFATKLLCQRLDRGGRVHAVDLSKGMLDLAQRKLAGTSNLSFQEGDAFDILASGPICDVLCTSWVLGYMPLAPFFRAAHQALKPGGRLGLVVHTQNSPAREFGLFSELVAQEPAVLLRQVHFDFPENLQHLKRELAAAGMEPTNLWEGTARFVLPDAEAVLEHLLKSGAGTVFYEAIAPQARPRLTERFLQRLQELNGPGPFEVRHDYVGCVAQRA